MLKVLLQEFRMIKEHRKQKVKQILRMILFVFTVSYICIDDSIKPKNTKTSLTKFKMKSFLKKQKQLKSAKLCKFAVVCDAWYWGESDPADNRQAAIYGSKENTSILTVWT